MIGVVLAGGKSERVPYKIFLSQKNNKPLYRSSLDLLKKTFLKKTVITNRENYLWHTTDLSLSEMKEDNYSGIVAVINSVLKDQDACVVCADNIYGDVTLYTLLNHIKENHFGAFARYVDSDRGPTGELDGWSSKLQRWVNRGEEMDLELTTPWLIPKGVVEADNVVDLLNKKQLKPIICNDPEWYDLGTMKSLEEYYS